MACTNMADKVASPSRRGRDLELLALLLNHYGNALTAVIHEPEKTFYDLHPEYAEAEAADQLSEKA